MTPKEKARELVEKYKNISIDFIDSIEGTCDMYINNEDAKECALIAVNEIIDYLIINGFSTQIEYWQKVRNEIETL